MRNFFKSGMILGTLLAVLYFSPASLAGDDSEETREILVNLFKAFNRHDVEAMVALYHPDVVIITPEHPGPRYGLDVIRGTYSSLFQDLPGVHDTVHRIISEGNQASVEFTAAWSFPGEDGTSIDLELNIASFVKIKDGKIIEDITYYDRMALEGSE
ncbi:MAG: nuclear transport factor 2 family protein [Proteobacteria bacterium]|nr:nuclear transport factor 2 family protein [Pseudomonadota bacterium]